MKQANNSVSTCIYLEETSVRPFLKFTHFSSINMIVILQENTLRENFEGKSDTNISSLFFNETVKLLLTYLDWQPDW